MPNDAKLGMVLGVGLVIIIAVVFFRRDAAPADAATAPAAPAAATVSPPASATPAAAPQDRPATGKGSSSAAPRPTLALPHRAFRPDSLPKAGPGM